MSGGAVPIALLQFDAREADRAGNLERVAAAIEESARRGARLLILPELWSSGYDLRSACAETGWEREVEAVAALSRMHDVAVVGSTLERTPREDRPANCATAIEAGEERARYRKVHLFGPLGEDRHLRPGRALPEVFPLAGLRVGMTVCYDLRFPELYRPLAAAGAELVTVSAQWPAVRIHHWRTLLIARAIETQCFVAGVNRIGDLRDVRFGGNSVVVSPTGEVVLDAAEGDGLYLTEVDPAAVAAARDAFPVFADRRTDLYGDSSGSPASSSS